MARTPIKDVLELAEGTASQEISLNDAMLKESACGGTIYLQDFDLVATPTGLVVADKGKVWKVAGAPTGDWSTLGFANKLALWTGSGWVAMDPQGATPPGTFVLQVKTTATSARKGELLAYSPDEALWYPVRDRWTDGSSSVAAEHWTGKYINGGGLGGKVWSKTIDFGTFPNTTTKNVAHSISNLDLNYLRSPLLMWRVSNGTAAMCITDVYQLSGSGMLITIDATNVSAVSNFDFSARSGIVRLEYVRTA